MKWQTAKRLVFTFVFAASLFPASAGADQRTVKDPDDSASVIDIAAVKQGHYSQYVLYRIDAFERWQPSDLDGGRIVVHFDLDSDPRIERRGVVEYVGGGGSQMRSTVVNAKGETVGRAVHRRPSSRSIEFWFKRWQLKHDMRFRAFVTVETSDPPDCSETSCVDRAPDQGSLLHKLAKLCLRREPTITGTERHDVLRGTKKQDVIAARGGDDQVTGVRGNDVVCGGPGDDVINGGAGFLFLRGGAGNDTISATGPRPTPCNDTGRSSASCAYPEAYLSGGAGNDLLRGGRFHERLVGSRGDDVLRGRRWSDGLDGGPGYDKGWGGGGSDGCYRIEEEHSCGD